MFGYLVVNPTQLDKGDKNLYRSFYCGLCHQLFNDYGNSGRRTLSYDLTFVLITLASVYDEQPRYFKERCPIHPLFPHQYLTVDCMGFAAAMNMLLYYYKCLDDYQDEGKEKALKKAQKLQESIDVIQQQYPIQSSRIRELLDEIHAIERKNILNPDIPANTFGLLMAEVFSYRDDEKKEALRSFGYQLGKFIYLMDACLDLRYDIRNELYNPLVALDTSNYGEVLELVISDTIKEYEKLPKTDYHSIMENVLYSGVWTRYKLQNKEKN